MMAGSLNAHRLLELPIMVNARLSVIERKEISRSPAEDPTVAWTVVGSVLGGHRSTVQRQVDRHGGRANYRAAKAQCSAEEAKPCRRPRLVADPDLTGSGPRSSRGGYLSAGAAHLWAASSPRRSTRSSTAATSASPPPTCYGTGGTGGAPAAGVEPRPRPISWGRSPRSVTSR